MSRDGPVCGTDDLLHSLNRERRMSLHPLINGLRCYPDRYSERRLRTQDLNGLRDPTHGLKVSFRYDLKSSLVSTAMPKPENKAVLDTSELGIAKRLRDAMNTAKVSNTQLAEATDTTVQGVGYWLKTGKIARDQLPAIAKTIRCSIDWLLTGVGPNTQIGPEIKGRVPIISWVQAGSFAQAVDNLQPGVADEWAETTVPIHQHTYALRVRGDSMTNPNGDPTFPDGSVIIVEPDAIDTPEKLIGSLVIVRRSGDDEATFKKLVRDGGTFFLRPLNPQYPMLELRHDDYMCGVVREKVMRFF